MGNRPGLPDWGRSDPQGEHGLMPRDLDFTPLFVFVGVMACIPVLTFALALWLSSAGTRKQYISRALIPVVLGPLAVLGAAALAPVVSDTSSLVTDDALYVTTSAAAAIMSLWVVLSCPRALSFLSRCVSPPEDRPDGGK